MKWCNFAKCFWVLVVLLFQYHCCCLGCLEEERIALLKFKASCNLRYRHLTSWVSEKGNNSNNSSSSRGDCCSWERVKCNATTGRVIQLSLNDLGLEIFSYLNVTIFSTFRKLQHLDLSNNLFEGWIKNEGFERLGELRKLEVLDLSGNYFNKSIIPSLAQLKSLQTLNLQNNINLEGSHLEEILSTLHNLKSLDLSYSGLETSSQIMQGTASLVGLGKLEVLQLYDNYFNNSIFPFLSTMTSLRTLSLKGNQLEGSLHIEELSNLHNLKSLDLSINYLNGSSQTMQALGKLHHLQSLDLSYNKFEYTSQAALQGLASLSELQSLHLSWNHMSCSSQAIQVFCGMKRLRELDLSWNNFEGNLPPCLQNLTSLTTLHLSYNQFKGNIPSSLISSLSSLLDISLGFNDFEGTLTFQSFTNLSKLEVIDLTNAGDKLQIESDQHFPWAPLFQLKQLLLSNCKFSKQMSNAIPRFLSNQYQLTRVDLSHCNLIGMFPNWLLENNTRLDILYLQDNSLRGNFLIPSYVHTTATVIDISNNCIDGPLQENMGNILPSVRVLNLSMNSLEGGIPASIGNMSLLNSLDLSNNKFIGEIPKHMALGCDQLFFLAISNNKFYGHVFPPHFNFTYLLVLKLDNNSFSGNILSGLSNSKDLEMLDISNNLITGRIPSWIGNLTSLRIFHMGGNLLQGDIPMEFQALMSLEVANLSQNNLSGSMVSILNSKSLRHLHLEGNGFISLPPHYLIVNNTKLITLDIRNNDLCGGIPDWMGVGFTGLRILLLQGNHFNGTIPNHLCQMNHIGLMDLSHNSLSGSIPQCLNNISFGRKQDIESTFHIEFNSWILGYLNEEEIEFKTKSWSWVYKGDILFNMSGLDLACNNLIGDIPYEIGTLNGLHALNLSHNQLSSSIPKTFSSLRQIESLDLSYNKLSGEIPSELAILNNLEVFIVAHNNLSGKTPEMNGQFSTFECNSYEGNPSLCVQSSMASSGCTNCSNTYGESTNRSTTSSSAMDNEFGIDMSAFIASFIASYVVCLLGIATILYINPYWRRMWFHFIEECMYLSHEFLSYICHRLYTCIW